MKKTIELIKERILREKFNLDETIKYLLEIKDEIRQMAKRSPRD
jgi:hypothetical protein